jgi:TRAP-type C4-dicarboxylate transport system permease large subunit
MKLRLATACATLTLGIASSALADGRLVATLETPQATKASYTSSSSVWNCAGSTCVGALTPGASDSVVVCRQLAMKVGRLTAYGSTRPFDEKTLAKCNAAAAAPGPIGTASR